MVRNQYRLWLFDAFGVAVPGELPLKIVVGKGFLPCHFSIDIPCYQDFKPSVRGFIKGRTPGKLTSCEDGFAWLLLASLQL